MLDVVSNLLIVVLGLAGDDDAKRNLTNCGNILEAKRRNLLDSVDLG